MSLLSKLDLKTIIGLIILCVTLCALAYFTNQCDEAIQVEPETLSHSEVEERVYVDNIDDEISLWRTMLEEEKEFKSIFEATKDEIAEIYIDDLTFNDAFALMRRMKGKDSTFIWRGCKYTTLLRSEI